MMQLEEDRRKFELRLSEMSQKVQEDSATIVRSSRTVAIIFGVALAVLTAVQVTIAVVSYTRPLRLEGPVNIGGPVIIIKATPTSVPAMCQRTAEDCLLPLPKDADD